MNRARAKNDFAAFDSTPSVARPYPNRHRRLTVELNSIDQRLSDDSQIRPPARSFEIAVVGRNARVVSPVHRVGRNAGAARRVVVIAPAVPSIEAHLAEHAVDTSPLFLRRSP